MGSSARGILAYGYDLGGNDGWNLREVDKYNYLDPAQITWFDDDNDDEDFPEQARKRLLASVGFSAVWEAGTDYYEREKAAQALVGVHFKTHGYGENPMYALVTKTITVDWGESKVLDLPALLAEQTEHGWDDRLAAALSALGITPTQEQPGWLLCAYYG